MSTIEVPLGMWQDAVPMLLSRLEGEGVTEDLTVSVMDALGYLTGDITELVSSTSCRSEMTERHAYPLLSSFFFFFSFFFYDRWLPRRLSSAFAAPQP